MDEEARALILQLKQVAVAVRGLDQSGPPLVNQPRQEADRKDLLLQFQSLEQQKRALEKEHEALRSLLRFELESCRQAHLRVDQQFGPR